VHDFIKQSLVNSTDQIRLWDVPSQGQERKYEDAMVDV
jgi:hypothetical protein